MTKLEKAKGLAERFGLACEEDPNLPVAGRFRWGDEFLLNPNKATAYTVLHELGHWICGYGCCREHDEMKAHGAALALARVAGIKLTKKEINSIDVYAGRSLREACAAFKGP